MQNNLKMTYAISLSLVAKNGIANILTFFNKVSWHDCLTVPVNKDQEIEN